MRSVAQLATALLLLVSCSAGDVPPSSSLALSPSPAPTAGSSTTPTAITSAASATAASHPGFGGAVVLVVERDGRLVAHRGATTDVLGQPCDAATGLERAWIAATKGSTRIAVVCAYPRRSTLFVRDPGRGLSYERDLIGVLNLGVPVLSPDTATAASAALGDCPMPAPGCESRVVLLDLEHAGWTTISPSEPHLGGNMHWTGLGLTYVMPECTPSGCPGAQKAGTWLWDGKASWTKWTQDALFDVRVGADGTVAQALLERTKSPSDRSERAQVVELRDGAARVITPSDVEREHPVALLPDGRIVAWRDDPDGTDRGRIAVYRDGKAIRVDNASLSGTPLGAIDGWVYTESYANGHAVLAYHADDGAVDVFPLGDAHAVAIVTRSTR